MTGSKVLGMAVLLAAATLLAATATATAVDDEHMYHLKCFTSCNTRCHDDDSAAVGHSCKNGCLNECFENLPTVCYQQCVVSNCLCKPPFSKEKMQCMKMCCDKCFHNGPAPPMPPKPTPPKPSPPKPTPPKPSPPKPTPPKPSPPKPTPPKPKPPCPPGGPGGDHDKVVSSIKN